MEQLYKRVEFAANVAIITVAVLVGAVVLKQYVLTSRASGTDQSFKEIAIGEQVAMEGTDWKQNRRTLLLVVSKGCRYCGESAPFYRRLAEESAPRNDVKLVAVLPQARTEAAEYLDGLGVKVSEIKQANFNTIRVRGTPTLILVDDNGTVVKKWLGKVPPEMESEVLATINCDNCGH